jgi:hypothetical protein
MKRRIFYDLNDINLNKIKGENMKKNNVMIKVILAALLLAGCVIEVPRSAKAEGETAEVNKYNIEMEMQQAAQRQQHIVTFVAAKGTVTLKQELVTDGNVAHVSIYTSDAGGNQKNLGEAILSGYEQADFQLPNDGMYEFHFRNFTDKWVDSESRFNISISAKNLQIKDTTVPKIKLPTFEKFNVWSEPFPFWVESDQKIVTVTLDGEYVDRFQTDETGKFPLTVYPEKLSEGFHNIGFIAGIENENYTILNRTFIVDNEDAFTDVTKSHWAHRPVEIMQLLGILNGRNEGLFEPDQSVTREEFAKILAISINLPVDNAGSADPFTDVAINAWSGPYIQALSKVGLVEGEVCGQGQCFYPNRPISRAEAAAMMARTGKVTGTGAIGERNFDDVKNLPLWAYEGIGELSKAGWIDGYEDGLFHPNGTLTRAEAAKLLGRFKKI